MSAAAAAAAGPHSPLFVWMKRRHDALARDIAEHGPRWEARAAEWAALGLTDRNGKPPGAHVARMTWHRVRAHTAERRRARGEAGAARSAPPARPGELAAGVRPAPAPPESPGGPPADAGGPLAEVWAEMNRRSGR